jgi:hypothetical protein
MNAEESRAESDGTEASHRQEPAEPSSSKPEGAGQQNGSSPRERGRGEEPPASERKQSTRREPKPAFTSEPRIIERSTGGEAPAEDQATPPRRGWWSR